MHQVAFKYGKKQLDRFYEEYVDSMAEQYHQMLRFHKFLS